MIVLAPLLIPLVALVAALFLLAANETSKTWLEPLIASTSTSRGGFFTRILTLPAKLLIRAGASAFSAVSHAISVAASHRLGTLTHWLDAMTARLALLRTAGAAFARDTAHGFERIAGHVIPREVGRATRPIDRRAKKALKIGVAAGLFGAGLAKHFAHVLGREVRPALHSLHRATAVTLPRAIGRVGARERALERHIREKVDPALRRLAKLTGVGVIVGLIVKTLARRFPWLFCRKVKTVGGRLCGLDQDLLNALLLDTVLIAGGISVVEFARELQAIEGAAINIMKSTIREL